MTEDSIIMIETKRPSEKLAKEFESIRALIYYHLEEGNSFSLWRLPNSNQKHLIVSSEKLKPIKDLTIEEIESGFIIAPFNPDTGAFFMKASERYLFEDGKLHGEQRSTTESKKIDFVSKSVNPKSFAFHQLPIDKQSDSKKDDYMQLVNAAKARIAEGDLEKVVPARCKTIEMPESLDLIETFEQLCKVYPDAFVSLLSSKTTGTWLGASPELLVQADGKTFSTAAVAGTQLVAKNTDLKSIAWTQKEIEEQALVSRYIINCFKKIRLREFEEHGPKTWQAGNLVHLKTDFTVDMNETNFPQLGSVMLKLLHPTSAVCGMPREKSLDFVRENEEFERGYFSGFLGPVNYLGESNLYVNLRCLQWNRDKIKLYAGAGVTSDSNPEKEWEETEMKMNTLLRIIDK